MTTKDRSARVTAILATFGRMSDQMLWTSSEQMVGGIADLVAEVTTLREQRERVRAELAAVIEHHDAPPLCGCEPCGLLTDLRMMYGDHFGGSNE